MASMKNIEGLLLLVAMSAMASMLVVQVQAVDIQGFDSKSACDGSGYTFNGIGAGVCTQFASTEGSVQFRDLSSCQTGTGFNGGGCTTSVLSANGPNVQCFIGGGFTGAAWFDNCRRRKLRATTGTDRGASCTSHAVPTGVHYTHPVEGTWILHTPNGNATLMLELLRALEDAEKANWLKAQGAIFRN